MEGARDQRGTWGQVSRYRGGSDSPAAPAMAGPLFGQALMHSIILLTIVGVALPSSSAHAYCGDDLHVNRGSC